MTVRIRLSIFWTAGLASGLRKHLEKPMQVAVFPGINPGATPLAQSSQNQQAIRLLRQRRDATE